MDAIASLGHSILSLVVSIFFWLIVAVTFVATLFYYTVIPAIMIYLCIVGIRELFRGLRNWIRFH